MQKDVSPPYTRYLLFALGAAVGSALGLVLGSLLTFWLGEGAVRTIQRGIRRITGNDDHPNFDLLLQ
jgi:membrane protein YqaA with SNARE-associated domain